MRRPLETAIAIFLLLGIAQPAAARLLQVQVGDISHPEARGRNLMLSLDLASNRLEISTDELAVGERVWRKVRLACPSLAGFPGKIDCPRGTLTSPAGQLPLAFSFDPASGRLALGITPQTNESWSLQARVQGDRWQGEATVRNGSLARLTSIQALPVAIGKGAVDGKASFSGGGSRPQQYDADFSIKDLTFGDSAGLHAGDKLAARLNLSASHSDTHWQWRANASWLSGEVFWQPFYFPSGGHALSAAGVLEGEVLTVNSGELALKDIGKVTFSGSWQRGAPRPKQLEASASGLDLANAYPLLAKPLLEKTLLGDLEIAGKVDARVRFGPDGPQSFEVNLHEVDLEDKGGRFAVYKVNAGVPWLADAPTQARLGFAGGRLLKVPLRNGDFRVALNGYSLTSPRLELALLDTTLALQDVSAAWINGQLHGHFRADLAPLSLGDFSSTLGWPRMEGKLSAQIPLVTYTNGRLTTDGALRFGVFDGSVAVTGLTMQNPLGLAPRLAANVEMRNLDLELLTRTYSFGAMAGRLDGDVRGLELSRWQPVAFDADFRSSPGNYPKKISQRAVENISALGGAGASAALQRSFLRFFKEFNYAKIGLSCKLRNGVCQMDGIEPAQAGYVIVKGSGIPAITVLGYNRYVSWGELLERVKRITQGNAKPIIK